MRRGNTARAIFRYGAHGAYAQAEVRQDSVIWLDRVHTPAGCYVESWPQRSHEPFRIEPKNLTWCVCACVSFHVMEGGPSCLRGISEDRLGTVSFVLYSMCGCGCMYSSAFGSKRITSKERTARHGSRHSHAHQSNRSKTDTGSQPRALGSYRTTRDGGHEHMY